MSALLPQMILCRFNRHRPVREKVHWDGQHYVGDCDCCGVRARRASKGLWRKDCVS